MVSSDSPPTPVDAPVDVDLEHSLIRMNIDFKDYLGVAFKEMEKNLDAWEREDGLEEAESEEETVESEGEEEGPAADNDKQEGREDNVEGNWEEVNDEEGPSESKNGSTWETPSTSAIPSPFSSPLPSLTPSPSPAQSPLPDAPAPILDASVISLADFQAKKKKKRKRSSTSSKSETQKEPQPVDQHDGADLANSVLPEDVKPQKNNPHARKHRKDTQGRKRRRRQRERAEAAGINYQIDPKLRKKFDKVLRVKLDVTLGEDIKACEGSFQGLHQTSKKTGNETWCPTLEELRQRNVGMLPWDGKMPAVVVDRTGRLIIVLVPPPADDVSPDPQPAADPLLNPRESPNDEKRPKDIATAGYDAVKNTHEELNWFNGDALPKRSGDKNENRRGDFKTFNIGWSMGCGSEKPGPFTHKGHNPDVLERYRNNKAIARLRRFANAVFAFYFPKMFLRYRQVLRALCAHPGGPGHEPPFPDAAFAAHSANAGPAAFAFMHEDFLNYAFGICAIQALGKFDHTKGGHLYFSQLGFATQFPAGCTVLLPSAAITHGNVPISVDDGEYRASLVHYTPAGLFRYVHYGFRTKTSIEKEIKADVKAQRKPKGSLAAWKRSERRKNPRRLQDALDMYSTTESLFADQELVVQQ